MSAFAMNESEQEERVRETDENEAIDCDISRGGCGERGRESEQEQVRKCETKRPPGGGEFGVL